MSRTNRFVLGRLLVVMLAGMLFLARSEVAAQTSTQIQNVTKPQITAIQDAAAARSTAQQKMASQLLDALKEKETGSVVSNAPNLKPGPLTETPEGVLLDIKAKVSDELLSEIQRLGGKVYNNFPEDDAIRASMPLENIETLAGRPDVQQVHPAVKARKNAIVPVAKEGDTAHAANLVRSKLGVRGAGIKVGVISDSIDSGYGDLQKAFDDGAMDRDKLAVLPGQDGNGFVDSSGEGLAMAEIIHVLAPDARILFATGYGGPAQMAANIRELVRQGCLVIVDDLTYNDESPFQDGPISQAVNYASSSGVLYFSSARNSGNKKQGSSGTWEGDFLDGGPAGPEYKKTEPKGRIHIFAVTPDGNRITLNTIDIASGGDRLDLFWSDPLGGATNQYDLFLVNPTGQVVLSSTTSVNGQQNPYQSIERIKQGYSIVIVKRSGSGDRFMHLDSGRAVLRYSTEGSVRGHNASGADNAFCVAAKQVPTPIRLFTSKDAVSLEKFCSDGPRRIFFQPDGTPLTPGNFSSAGGLVLRKPDITAADGVSTTLSRDSGLNPFSGTSAAAPHAAGIAALLLSCDPRPSADQVRRALEKT
jgi:subtilisin family serine protease